jgi:poly-gamma-glutamate capsule biosynthesis protein CapA/YwtB (metallophosphatase superfamily)
VVFKQSQLRVLVLIFVPNQTTLHICMPERPTSNNKNMKTFVIILSITSLLSMNLSKAFSTMSNSPSSKNLRVVFNGGDNMLGRAVQLSFPVQAPGEEHITDSCPGYHYLHMCLHPSGHPDGDLSLAEIREQNKQGNYLWKDYRKLRIDPPPDVRLLNVESHITRSIDKPDLPLWKGIRYHTHVDNLDTMIRPYAETTHGGESASPVVLSLANNHVIDYGRTALDTETLPAIKKLQADMANVSTVGIGGSWLDASKPAEFKCSNTNVQVFAVSSGCSGTPTSWWANDEGKSGLVGIPALVSKEAITDAVEIVKRAIESHPCPEDKLRILSVHMGPNWALKGEDEKDIACRRDFAHKVIDDCDVDIVYGHSSHHMRGMEVYKGKLILYGTGDIINDYEGFENRGEDKYNRLGGIFIADIDAGSGNLRQLQIVPMFMNRLRLERYKKGSQLWSPNQKRLVTNEEKGKDLCTFINELSLIDAGNEKAALTVKYVDESKSNIPGGPVLQTDVFAFN